MISLLLRKAIFFEGDVADENMTIPLTARFRNSLKNRRFRHHLTKQIIAAKKNVSGHAGQNLNKLYLQLGLDSYAVKLISSEKWHLMAFGIQQLGTMEVKTQLPRVYKHTNHKNELVRVEAQIAVLNLSGFEGLRFLDVITYQISEWQQIKLLKELSLIPHVNLQGIDKWLKSDNPSVVVFALKLARNYHHFELYEDIISCLNHPNSDVRIQAVYTLTDIFTGETSKVLLKVLETEEISNQLTILKAIRKIGDEEDLPTLEAYLPTENLDLKLATIRAMAHIGDKGWDLLYKKPAADTYPLNEMLVQVKKEVGK